MVKLLYLSVIFTTLFLGSFSQNFVSSSFAQNPEEIIDTSFAEDFPFIQSIHAGNYVDNSSIVIWGINWTNTSTITLTRRLIDISTYYQVGSDVLINTNITSSIAPNFTTSSNGYLGMLTVNGSSFDNNTQQWINQIYLTIIPTNASSNTKFSTTQITTNGDSSITYAIYYLGAQDGNFYIGYVTESLSQNVELGIYVQIVQINGTTKIFSNPVQANVRTLNNILWTSNVVVGITPAAQNSAGQNTSLVAISWKDSNSLQSLLSAFNSIETLAG